MRVSVRALNSKRVTVCVGCGASSLLFNSIGVADVEDLELVTKEDLVDLGFDDADANNMMKAIEKIA